MRIKLVLFALTVCSFLACSHSASIGDPASAKELTGLAGATIEVSREGGFAALAITHAVKHDDGAYVYVQRRLCGSSCGVPLDSASGTLSASTADSLFTIVLAQDPFSLREDYGATRGGADMMTYVI